MSIERLSGGLTPADGSDPRTFPEIFNGFADEFEEVQTRGFRFVETVTFTSNGTFSKGDFPWLRAIRVKCQGGGGGGGGNQGCDDLGEVCTASGGGGGGFGEKFYLESELSESISVTVGLGGAGGAGGPDGDTGDPGNPGGASSFGSQTATGGEGGLRGFETLTIQTVRGVNGGTADGDFQFSGVASGGATCFGANIVSPLTIGLSSAGAPGFFGGGGAGRRMNTGANSQFDGGDAISFGDGGGGALTGARNSFPITGANGGNGGPGIVIVELFA